MASTSDPRAPAARPTPRASTSCRRVLVVEDIALIALDMADTLASAGWEIVGPYRKLEQALQAARNEDLACAVLDYDLSGTSASPVAEALAAREVPFLMCTGHYAAKLAFPNRPHIAKPYDQRCLQDAVLALAG